jgi:hypothetical protein
MLLSKVHLELRAKELDTVAHAYNSRYLGGGNRRIELQASLGKKLPRNYLKEQTWYSSTCL